MAWIILFWLVYQLNSYQIGLKKYRYFVSNFATATTFIPFITSQWGGWRRKRSLLNAWDDINSFTSYILHLKGKNAHIFLKNHRSNSYIKLFVLIFYDQLKKNVGVPFIRGFDFNFYFSEHYFTKHYEVNNQVHNKFWWRCLVSKIIFHWFIACVIRLIDSLDLANARKFSQFLIYNTLPLIYEAYFECRINNIFYQSLN